MSGLATRVSGAVGGFHRVAAIALLVVSVAIPVIGVSAFHQDIAATVMLFALLALGLHVAFGLSGCLWVGFAAFPAIGGYVAAIANTRYDVPIWLCLPLAAAAAAAFAVAIGGPVLRLRNEYFIVATLAVGELVPLSIKKLEITGGVNGIYAVDKPELFGVAMNTPTRTYCFIFGAVVLAWFVIARFQNTTTGRCWVAVGLDDRAADALGVSSYRVRLSALAAGAGIGGIAGWFYVGRLTTIAPDSFTVNESVIVLAILFVGGVGSLLGVALGAMAMVGLPEVFRGLTEWRLVAFGVSIMVMLRIRRRGLLPPGTWSPRWIVGRRGDARTVDSGASTAQPSPTAAAP